MRRAVEISTAMRHCRLVGVRAACWRSRYLRLDLCSRRVLCVQLPECQHSPRTSAPAGQGRRKGFRGLPNASVRCRGAVARHTITAQLTRRNTLRLYQSLVFHQSCKHEQPVLLALLQASIDSVSAARPLKTVSTPSKPTPKVIKGELANRWHQWVAHGAGAARCCFLHAR